MRIKYSVVSIGILIIWIMFILFFSVSKFIQTDVSIFDYEGFALFNIFIYFIILFVIYGVYKNSKIFIGKNSINIKNNEMNEIPFEDITGIETNFFPSKMTLFSQQKTISIYTYFIKNQKELLHYFTEEKKINKILPDKIFLFFNNKDLGSWIKSILFLIIFISNVTFEAYQLKYYLPLNAINTIEIEGELTNDINLSKRIRTFGNRRVSTYPLTFKNYPDYRFRYVESEILKDKISSFGDGENFRIKSGETVKIRIRKNTFDKVKSNTLPKSFMGWDFTYANEIKFYSLEYQDKILIEKSFLKK